MRALSVFHSGSMRLRSGEYAGSGNKRQPTLSTITPSPPSLASASCGERQHYLESPLDHAAKQAAETAHTTFRPARYGSNRLCLKSQGSQHLPLAPSRDHGDTLRAMAQAFAQTAGATAGAFETPAISIVQRILHTRFIQHAGIDMVFWSSSR